MTEEEKEEQIQNWTYRMNLEYDQDASESEIVLDKQEVINGIKKHGNSTWIFNKSYVRVLFGIPDHIPNVQIDKYIMEQHGNERHKETA